jgi:hypothetical protein
VLNDSLHANYNFRHLLLLLQDYCNNKIEKRVGIFLGGGDEKIGGSLPSAMIGYEHCWQRVCAVGTVCI